MIGWLNEVYFDFNMDLLLVIDCEDWEGVGVLIYVYVFKEFLILL